MIAFFSSYLFARRTHVNDLWTRRTGKTAEFWTRDSVPGRRFGPDKPVYILTSGQTFSAAEEFAYNLKSLKQASIVGETTGGGAHPVWGRRVGEQFVIGVPSSRAVNPITHTNWESTGVEPECPFPLLHTRYRDHTPPRRTRPPRVSSRPRMSASRAHQLGVPLE
jgi:retinol-binding protein 3